MLAFSLYAHCSCIMSALLQQAASIHCALKQHYTLLKGTVWGFMRYVSIVCILSTVDDSWHTSSLEKQTGEQAQELTTGQQQNIFYLPKKKITVSLSVCYVWTFSTAFHCYKTVCHFTSRHIGVVGLLHPRSASN